MNKEFLPYEQALALKELGFDEPCLASYETAFGKGIDFELGYIIDGPKNYVLAPLYQQAFRWFREKHGMIFNLVGDIYYYPSITFVNTDGASEIELGEFNTYEEAELECLKKLIELAKDKG